VSFLTLSTKDDTTIYFSRYSSLRCNTKGEFDASFSYFKNQRIILVLFANPFLFKVNNIDAKFHLEFIDIQSTNSWTKAHTKNYLLTFYKKYIKIEEYPNFALVVLHKVI